MVRALRYRNFTFRLAIASLPIVSFAIAGLLRFFLPSILHLHRATGDVRDYLFLLLLTLLAWAVALERYSVSSVQSVFGRSHVRFAGVRACVATFTFVLATTFFIHGMWFSRLFVALSGTIQIMLTVALIASVRFIHERTLRSGSSIRVLIIGADEFARQTADRLRQSPILRCAIVGFVRLPDQDAVVADAHIFEFHELENLTVGTAIDDIVVAIPAHRLPELSDLTNLLRTLSIPVRAVLDFGQGIRLEQKLFQMGELQMIDLHPSPSESLVYLLPKRIFDVAFAATAIAVTSPLILVIAVLIRLSSPGPIIFAQERVGLNGRIFRMYKFRTMKVASVTESNVRWTVKNDPRRTTIGTFLRRTSLDELPQFFNVLKGDMSVVGPRPERPYYVNKFGKELVKYHARHQLKVGITGWAQVNGLRGDSSISERLEHDLYYLSNWSLGFDLQIIFLTVFRGLLGGANAY